MFGGNFAPAGWQFCDGSQLAIAENEVLFQLIGTTYGGDGQSTFNVPDLRGRLPIHMGGGFTLGQPGGVETVALTVNQIPSHSHPFVASTSVASQTNPTGNLVAQSTQATVYIDSSPNPTMAAAVIQPAGGNQPHTNFQPYLCVSFIISLFGIFPSPT
jgi:microcystin-dependent protein